jgi:hypothetical protein
MVAANFGTGDWWRVARHIPGRNARQCRERWENYLCPSIRNAPWTPEEEQLLLQKYSEIGPMWKQIASFFSARTAINVKSRWRLIQRRMRRQAWKQVGSPQGAEQIDAECGEQPQAQQFEETWDSSMMNDDGPSDNDFDYWLNGSLY